MNPKGFGSAVIACFLSVSLLFTASVNGQSVPKKVFSQAALQVAQKTDSSYTLLRLGSNSNPAILTPNRAAKTRSVSASQRNDSSSVSNFAMKEAQYLAANALSLYSSAELQELSTSRTGDLWLSSYSVAYQGIPLRERYLRLNIGALNGEVMLVRNNIPAKTPNTLAATITSEEVIQKTKMLLGIHASIKATPQLVFVDETEGTSLRLCYEVRSSEPEMHEFWRLTFDAVTGDLIEKKSLVQHSDCFSGEQVVSQEVHGLF